MIQVLEVNGLAMSEDAESAAYALGRYMLFNGLDRQAVTADGYTMVGMREDEDVKIFVIMDGAGNFLSIPRLLGVNNGCNDKLITVGDGSLDYPLDSTGDTTQTLILDSGNVPDISRDGQLFGNIDWIGINTAAADEVSNAPVLTWKGPTGRTLPFNPKEAISGLTVPDIKFSETGPDYFTCFGQNVYQSGDILYSVPAKGDVEPRVLGAALQNDTLICVVNNHYPDKTGFFDEVWINDEIIYSTPSGRPTICRFFNQSGTKCTQGNKEWTIDLENKLVTVTTYDPGKGAYSVANVRTATESTGLTATQVTDNTLTIRHEGAYATYSDYKGDERIQVQIKVSDITVRQMTTTVIDTSQESGIHYQGVKPEAVPYVISGPYEYNYTTREADYSVTGSADACCTANGYWVWPPSDACGMQNVQFVDACGAIYSKSVKMVNGHWELVSTNYAYLAAVTDYSPPGCVADSTYHTWAASHFHLASGLSSCSDFFGGYTASAYSAPTPVESGGTKTVTTCGSFSTGVANDCSHGERCGGTATKVAASGGSGCLGGEQQINVAVYAWSCP